MAEDNGSDVDTGLRMRDLRANVKALLQYDGVQGNITMGDNAASRTTDNTKRYVQLLLKADVEFDGKSDVIEEVRKRMVLAITSPTSPQQLIPQDTSPLPSATSDPLPQQDLQRKEIELLMKENDLVKRICNVFETNGATLVDVRSGSIVFTLEIKSRNGLKSFWKAYGDGSLQSQLQDILITNDLERQAGCSLFLQLHIDEKEYFQGLEDFGKQELRLVLVGRTGTGKSTTGNHILLKSKKSERPFSTSVGGSSSTEICHYSSNEVLGRTVVVVDTPGLFDTSRENVDVLPELTRFLLYTEPGPHAVILVMKAGVVTEEVQETVTLLVKLLKKDVYSYMIVLFTGKDKMDENDTTLEEYLKTLPSVTRGIIKKCEDRCITFNNKFEASSDENRAQVDALLQMIDDNVHRNGENCFESDLHKEIRPLVSNTEMISDPETFREAVKCENVEAGGWFVAAVAHVAAFLDWEMFLTG